MQFVVENWFSNDTHSDLLSSSNVLNLRSLQQLATTILADKVLRSKVRAHGGKKSYFRKKVYCAKKAR